MSIKLDHAAKVALLEAVRAGEMEESLLRQLTHTDMTLDDIEAELDRLCKVDHDRECQRIQRLGLCKYYNKD